MAQNEQTNALVSELRSEAFSGTNDVITKKVMKLNGKSFEIRKPSLGEKSQIQSVATGKVGPEGVKFDATLQSIHAVILCTYVPDTEQRVFNMADLDSIRSKPSGHFIQKLGDAVVAMMNKEDEAGEVTAKNSAPAT